MERQLELKEPGTWGFFLRLGTMSKHLTEPNPVLAKFIRATPHGMAHWAGTGPTGAMCGQCANFGYFDWNGRHKPNGCALYFALTGVHGKHPLPEVTPACKYFNGLTAERGKEPQ
jgi:hypothetical protein